MRAARRVTGRALPLDRANVDTDQIIPSHWLKSIARTGYAAGLFEAWRKDPSFVLNDRRYEGASILIAGPNFGSGSSREHAVWALDEAGFRAVVAPRLAEIFRANCLKSGLVPAEIEPNAVAKLLRLVERDPRTEITVDVASGTVEAPGVRTSFTLDAHARSRLLEGLDDIAVTLERERDIAAFEATRPSWLPSIDR